ncbi:phospho-sugar mutase [Brevibacterium daeguense]|uniref:Phospho-sugar mutase n=1 Tax=Brevibacterium daeguense TaxID=909936 RepID=A0ABP8EG21_9MICO|nr:phospho-sugar mutase [Brevibacterium daeguense]
MAQPPEDKSAQAAAAQAGPAAGAGTTPAAEPAAAQAAAVAAASFDPAVVRAWIEDDPDPLTRSELAELLALAEDGHEGAAAELAGRFSGPLEFGTAGLRGAVAAGPNRMNRAVVIRAAAGIAAFLDDTVGAGFSVAIGADARHGSHEFAVDTAAVITGAGGRALLLPPELPTPVLAFTLRYIDADAGIMVTASHNPKQDNGYKVYLGHAPLAVVAERLGEDPALAHDGAGAQIVAPFDQLIAERISAVPSVADTVLADESWERLGDEVLEAYLQRIEALGAHASGPLRIVLTSLHGVGGYTALQALDRCGFTDVHVVESQALPNPDFPTVAFPNPEEPGALDAAIALAEEVDADLIVAHDPDADRFSAAVPDPSGWTQLTGDEVGILLGERLAARWDSAAEADRARAVLACSVVSSRGLARVAAAHGLRHTTTLTGFKWISRVHDLVFGYEEALGYCVDPEAVKDKDGISAAVEFAALTSELAFAGRTVHDELARIRRRDGVFVTAPLTFRMTDLTRIPLVMESVRTAPPEALAGSGVTGVVDLAEGSDELPPTDGLVISTARDDRVVIRPSGTEPKLKCYLEVVEDPGGDDAEALARANARMAELRAAVAEYLAL